MPIISIAFINILTPINSSSNLPDRPDVKGNKKNFNTTGIYVLPGFLRCIFQKKMYFCGLIFNLIAQ